MLEEKNIYNKKAYFNKRIYPIMQQLVKECYFAKIPCFFSAAVANTDFSSVYVSECVSDTDIDFKLYDDKISEFIKVLRGAKVTFTSDIEEMDFEGLDVGSFEINETDDYDNFSENE